MDVKERLLEAAKNSETTISFSDAVSVTLEEGVYKVGDWKGSEVDDVVKKVEAALRGPGEVVILAENVSLADLIWVTKPYDKLADAPENIRELDGAKLTLSQVNWIANMADGLKGKKDIKSPWGLPSPNSRRRSKRKATSGSGLRRKRRKRKWWWRKRHH